MVPSPIPSSPFQRPLVGTGREGLVTLGGLEPSNSTTSIVAAPIRYQNCLCDHHVEQVQQVRQLKATAGPFPLKHSTCECFLYRSL